MQGGDIFQKSITSCCIDPIELQEQAKAQAHLNSPIPVVTPQNPLAPVVAKTLKGGKKVSVLVMIYNLSLISLHPLILSNLKAIWTDFHFITHSFVTHSTQAHSIHICGIDKC